MEGDWEMTTVGELVKRGVLERPMDGNHGSIHPKGDDFVSSGVPFIMASDLVGGGIDTVDCSFITLKQAKSLRKGFAKPGDVLISHKATLGRTAIVGEIPGEFVMLTPQVTYYRPKDPTKLNNRYLKYYFDSAQFQQVLQSWAGGGSTRAYIGITDQLRLPVLLPPLPEQKAIATVMGALDDKIALNRRMNATLEAMARALFQSWFVDFDPVRAKQEGRTPAGLDEPTAALFAGKFGHEADGLLPKDWKVGAVKDAFDLTMGQSPPGETYNEEGNGIPFYQGRTDFGFRLPTRRVFCTAPTRYGKFGDTLVSVRAPVGDINMADEECCIGRGVAAVRHKSGATSFTYHAMASLYPDFAAFEAEGTVFGSINKQNFENLKFIIPPPKVVAAYERKARSLDDQVRTLEHQSRILATLRDTLLPKLLSGDVGITKV
jgi:type I restriction enzyme S subunit